MVLHIVNKSLFSSPALEKCVTCAKPGSTILLIEDGVYAAVKLAEGSDMEALLGAFTFYALKPDVEARGLSHKMDPAVKLIDYSEFVKLTTEFKSSHSWF